MAGRPLGLRSLMKALSRYSRTQLQKLVDSIPTKSDMVVKLERQREKLVGALAKLDRQIAGLSRGNGSATAPARRARKRGRRKGYKLSAATRNRMRIAALKRYGKKSEATASAPAAGKKTRKPFSAETKARMAASQKARWAKKKEAATTHAEIKA